MRRTRRLIEDLNARDDLTFYPLGDGYQDTLDSLFTNLRFARALRKARTPYSVEGCRYPVYLVSALPSPCLFGVLRPAIYLLSLIHI